MSTNQTEPAYLTRKGAANRARCSVSKIDKLKAAGAFPHLKVGGQVLFRVVDIDRYLNRHEIDPSEPVRAINRARGVRGRFCHPSMPTVQC